MADKKPSITDQASEAGEKARKAWEENKKETRKKQLLNGGL